LKAATFSRLNNSASRQLVKVRHDIGDALLVFANVLCTNNTSDTLAPEVVHAAFGMHVLLGEERFPLAFHLH
jgi:hypothetical protein